MEIEKENQIEVWNTNVQQCIDQYLNSNNYVLAYETVESFIQMEVFPPIEFHSKLLRQFKEEKDMRHIHTLFVSTLKSLPVHGAHALWGPHVEKWKNFTKLVDKVISSNKRKERFKLILDVYVTYLDIFPLSIYMLLETAHHPSARRHFSMFVFDYFAKCDPNTYDIEVFKLLMKLYNCNIKNIMESGSMNDKEQAIQTT
eukprot:TRINITY_DN12463_c0_g1_i1.p1 TRINITY_DN12463_c0_g1~~TRINITY_DN12463_c0_g1_i1.p1  ORF type:complete len:200 (+),score=28.51 TRINITY_DN12463_c0_g1_i1:3-602(+)